MARNINDAFVEALRLLMSKGEVVTVRGGKETKELRSNVIRIEHPIERVLLTPHRNGNIFAALAETMWVLGGRKDMAYLSRYLPRAKDFSDDGFAWRAAYGPRLRCWDTDGECVDQLEECVRLLNEDPTSRQAVMCIFDPALDYVNSKDIPCNNWLHWLIRNGELHLTVAIRSNDAIWGWSGINFFEWSVLHEMMAFWTHSRVGSVTYIAGSFHIYDGHYDRAERIIAGANGCDLYKRGFTGPRFETPFSVFDARLGDFFVLEDRCRKDEKGTDVAIDEDISLFEDPFIGAVLQMLRVYNAHLNQASDRAVSNALNWIVPCDLRLAAIEYLIRAGRNLVAGGDLVFHPEERSFFKKYDAAPEGPTLDDICSVLRELHAKKSRAYGNSWRKHGELMSIFANISRKHDRLESVYAGSKSTGDECIMDTLADLAVYAMKYLTFLAETTSMFFQQFLDDNGYTTTSVVHCLGEAGFDSMPAIVMTGRDDPEFTFAQNIDDIGTTYRMIERTLNGASGISHRDKITLVSDLAMGALRAMVALAADKPVLWRDFALAVERM